MVNYKNHKPVTKVNNHETVIFAQVLDKPILMEREVLFNRHKPLSDMLSSI